jgi:hypothetical protein
VNTNNEIASSALRSGEQTSEYQVTQSAGAWSVAMMVCGIITTVLPDLIAALKQSKDVAGSETGHTIIVVGGLILALAGAVLKGLTAASYTQSRGLVKAAAARDLDLTPPPVTVVSTPPVV